MPTQDDEVRANLTAGGDAVPATARRPMTPGERQAFSLLSASTAPVWLAMIVAPRSRVTALLVRASTPLTIALGGAYVALLASSILDGGDDAGPTSGQGGEHRGAGRGRLDDPETLRAALGTPTAFLAGWTHYLVFDLLVGRAIHEHALARGRTARLSLLLTWWVGPAGWTLHLLDRWRHRDHRSSTADRP